MQHPQQQQQYNHYRRAEDERHAVSSHYNERRQQTKTERQQSPIYALRCVNNWVKAVLIEDHVLRDACVLDLCGGRGGDLDKWAAQSAAHVTLVDIAEDEVERARERWNNSNNRDRVKSARFQCADAFVSDSSVKQWALPSGYDAVACQFALHYAFESEAKLRALLCNVATSLKTDGVFICSFTDGERVTATCFDYQTQQEREFDNGVCRIRFDYGRPAYIYGTRYHFTLGDAINDCPEYCVHLPTLVEEARAVGLHLVRTQTFDELCHNAIDRCPHHAEKWKRMVNTEIPIEQWHAIGLYRACVFARDDRPLPKPQPVSPPQTAETAIKQETGIFTSTERTGAAQQESPSKYDYQPFANSSGTTRTQETSEKKRSVVSYEDAWHDHERCEGESFVLSGPALDGSGTADSRPKTQPVSEEAGTEVKKAAPTLRLKSSTDNTKVSETASVKKSDKKETNEIKPKSALKKKASESSAAPGDVTTAESAKKKARIAIANKDSEKEVQEEAKKTAPSKVQKEQEEKKKAPLKVQDEEEEKKKAPPLATTEVAFSATVVPVVPKKPTEKAEKEEKVEEVPQSFARKPTNVAVMRDGRLLEKTERVKTGDKFALGNSVYVKHENDGWVLQP